MLQNDTLAIYLVMAVWRVVSWPKVRPESVGGGGVPGLIQPMSGDPLAPKSQFKALLKTQYLTLGPNF